MLSCLWGCEIMLCLSKAWECSSKAPPAKKETLLGQKVKFLLRIHWVYCCQQPTLWYKVQHRCQRVHFYSFTAYRRQWRGWGGLCWHPCADCLTILNDVVEDTEKWIVTVKGDVILFAHGAFFLHCLSVWPWLNISMNCSSYHGSKRGLSIVFPLIGLGLTREKDCVLMFCIAFLFCFLSCRCLCWDIQNDEVAKLKKNQNSWLQMPTAIQGRLR